MTEKICKNCKNFKPHNQNCEELKVPVVEELSCGKFEKGRFN